MGVHVENIYWIYLLFKFDGRISRAKFWAGIAATWAISIGLWILIGASFAANVSAIYVIVWLVAIAGYVAIFWMGLAISIKRWHDRGKSG
jgi:uncharacterized membrane protein YhaH (DUF805 family)